MLHSIHFYGEDIVSKPILKQFEQLILEKHQNYSNDEVIYERLEKNDILYRLKFEFFNEPILLVHVLEFKEIPKN